MAITRPDGTFDMLPAQARQWARYRDMALQMFARYGYEPVETPVFEKTELFVRGIGEATDVVSKEMFHVISGGNLDKLVSGKHVESKSRFSLRPEGTAGVVRAVAQNGLVEQGAPPVKLAYAGPMFRAERPQHGRQRQFNQVGIECLGADDPSIDAEGIIMAMRFFEELGIPAQNMRLLVNSMGCESCRPAYRQAVKDFIDAHADDMCDDCRRRAELNPLRAFDCKQEGCKNVMADAPLITEWLDDGCRSHYDAVLAYLDDAGISYTCDPTLVRGLDYYTRTVFEVQVVTATSGQNAIGGGGRYDKLMEEVGGKPTPGFGFALGYERSIIALEEAGVGFDDEAGIDLFVAVVQDDARRVAFGLAQECRDAGLQVEIDHQGRSLKSQFKLADKLGAAQVAILGPDELAANMATLRDMKTHEERKVALSELPNVVQ